MSDGGYVSGDSLGAGGADLTALSLSRNPPLGSWSSSPGLLWGNGLPADTIVGAGRVGPLATKEMVQGLGVVGAGFTLYGAMGTAQSAGSSIGSGQYSEGIHDAGVTTLGAYNAASGLAGLFEGGSLANPLLASGAAAVLSWDLAYRNTMQAKEWERNLHAATESCDAMRELVRRYREEIQKMRACCGSH